MKTFNNLYNEVINSDNQSYRCFITIENKRIEEDIADFKLTEVLGINIAGNIKYKEVEFTLFNSENYKLTDKEIYCYISVLVNNEFIDFNLGKFKILEASKTDKKSDEVKVKAVCDNFLLNEEINIVNTKNKAIGTLLSENNLTSDEFVNLNYKVLDNKKYEIKKEYFKELAEALGGNLDFQNRKIVKLEKTPKYTINKCFELEVDDNLVKPINTVVASRIKVGEETTEDEFLSTLEFVETSPKNEYKIISNQLIDDDRKGALPGILESVKDYTYIPLSLECVLMPHLESGDYISVIDGENIINTYIQELEHDVSTGTTKIKSTAQTKTQTDYKSATSKYKIKNVEFKVNKLNAEITSLATEVDDNKEKMTKITQNVDKIETQVINNINLSKEIIEKGVYIANKALAKEILEFKVFGSEEKYNNIYPNDLTFPFNELNLGGIKDDLYN